MVLNGFYEKEALGLKGGFEPPKAKAAYQLDKRLLNPNENFNQKNVNQVYQPNTKLLNEIEHAKKVREY